MQGGSGDGVVSIMFPAPAGTFLPGQSPPEAAQIAPAHVQMRGHYNIVVAAVAL